MNHVDVMISKGFKQGIFIRLRWVGVRETGKGEKANRNARNAILMMKEVDFCNGDGMVWDVSERVEQGGRKMTNEEMDLRCRLSRNESSSLCLSSTLTPLPVHAHPELYTHRHRTLYK